MPIEVPVTDNSSTSVSTLRAAIELKGVFDLIAAVERQRSFTGRAKESRGAGCRERPTSLAQGTSGRLIESLAMSDAEQGTKLEIESVLREACDRDPPRSPAFS
jgi:hypothetical protein